MEDILRNINQLHRRGYILDSDTFPQVKADSSRKFTASLIDYINSKTTSSPILAYIVLRQYLKGK